MERKALERLVSALLDDDHKVHRVETISNALALALVALEGDEDFSEADEETVAHSLFMLAIQVLAQKMADENKCVLQCEYRVDDEDADDEDFDTPADMQVFVTTDEALGEILNFHLKAATRTNLWDVN